MRSRLWLCLIALLSPAYAQAHIIELGQMTLTGNFTLDHTFDFNHAESAPFGRFGELIVQDATGIFAPYVSTGDAVLMDEPSMYESYGFDPIEIPGYPSWFGTLAQPMLWSIGGFQLDTRWSNLTGASWAGMTAIGLMAVSGNGFDPYAYPFAAESFWVFEAPAFDHGFPTDITGAIDMTVTVRYDDHVVPEPPTWLLAMTGLLLLWAGRRLAYRQH